MILDLPEQFLPKIPTIPARFSKLILLLSPQLNKLSNSKKFNQNGQLLSKNENFQRFKTEGADCVLFTSSSTVHNYVAATESLDFKNGLKPKFGSIGVKTSETLRQHNLPIAFESPKANLDNFVVETLSYFRNNKEQIK